MAAASPPGTSLPKTARSMDVERGGREVRRHVHHAAPQPCARRPAGHEHRGHSLEDGLHGADAGGMQQPPDRPPAPGPDLAVVGKEAFADHRPQRLLLEVALAVVVPAPPDEGVAHHLRVIRHKDLAAQHADGHDLTAVGCAGQGGQNVASQEGQQADQPRRARWRIRAGRKKLRPLRGGPLPGRTPAPGPRGMDSRKRAVRRAAGQFLHVRNITISACSRQRRRWNSAGVAQHPQDVLPVALQL